MNKRVKIIHWNISKRPHPVYVLRKYEDVLFSHIKELRQDWNIGRIWRSDGKIFGSTVFSWFFYKSNNADIVHAMQREIWVKSLREIICVIKWNTKERI